MAAELRGLDGDAVEGRLQRHAFIMAGGIASEIGVANN